MQPSFDYLQRVFPPFIDDLSVRSLGRLLLDSDSASICLQLLRKVHLRRRTAIAMPRLPWPTATSAKISAARRALFSRPANGHTTFIPQLRKLVFEYCDVWPSSANLRRYLYNSVEHLAAEYPHVEVVVKQRPSKEPVVRGFYREYPSRRVPFLLLSRHPVNGRDKVIGLKGYQVTQIQQKVQLLLDSSGAKIVPLKRKTVVSTTESARGIWSGLHTPEPYRI